MANIFIMKTCFKCGIEKPLIEFYVHKEMADGHLNKCKDCTKSDVSKKHIENSKSKEYVEKERKRGRQKYHRLYVGTSKSKKHSNLKWEFKYPEKRKASLASQRIKKPFEGAEKHHWSYNDEHFKCVIWLSKKHHMKAHRFLVYDQERKMYRRYDTNELLDTKERHETFILNCINNLED